MDAPEPHRQPLIQADVAPLRCCLLSGGESRRMGRDKALLPHPEGGTWLERTLGLLAELGAPITLLSRHPGHLAIAAQLAQPGLIEMVAEPPPWEGPLRALDRLMRLHPNERLLLCPVDMPWLDAEAIRAVAAASCDGQIVVAHDGQRLQPLLGVYPATPDRSLRLDHQLAAGKLGLQRWLAGESYRTLTLPAGPMRNVNRHEEWRSAS